MFNVSHNIGRRNSVSFNLVPEVEFVDFYGNRLKSVSSKTCNDYYNYGNLCRRFEVNRQVFSNRYSTPWCSRRSGR